MSDPSTLRALMRERMAERRITHQLAKYIDGQLQCSLCQTPQAPEAWELHLRSEEHRATLSRLRERLAAQKKPSISSGSKRTFAQSSLAQSPSDPTPTSAGAPVSKQRRVSQQQQRAQTPVPPASTAVQPSPGPVLPAGFFDDEEEAVTASAELSTASAAPSEPEAQAQLQQEAPSLPDSGPQSASVTAEDALSELELQLQASDAQLKKERVLARKELKSVRKLAEREEEKAYVNKLEALKDRLRLFSQRITSSVPQHQEGGHLADAEEEEDEEDVEIPSDYEGDPDEYVEQVLEQRRRERERMAASHQQQPASDPENDVHADLDTDDADDLDGWRGKSLY